MFMGPLDFSTPPKSLRKNSSHSLASRPAADSRQFTAQHRRLQCARGVASRAGHSREQVRLCAAPAETCDVCNLYARLDGLRSSWS